MNEEFVAALKEALPLAPNHEQPVISGLIAQYGDREEAAAASRARIASKYSDAG